MAIGAHHDTIPSTSRSAVHENEAIKFYEAIIASNNLLVNLFLPFLKASINPV